MRKPELLAAAAKNLEERQNVATCSPATSAGATPSSSKKKSKKSRDEIKAELFGAMNDSTTKANPRGEKTVRNCKAQLRLARYMTGDKKGKPTGKVYYTINSMYSDNKALVEVVQATIHAVRSTCM